MKGPVVNECGATAAPVAQVHAFARTCLVASLLVASGCRQLLSSSSYDVTADAGTSCDLARPVGPPTEQNVPGSAEYTFAVRRIDVGDGSVQGGSQTPGQIGYDIDGICSSAKNPGRCKNGGSAVLDGPGGRDNALGALIAGIPDFLPDFPLTVQVMNDQVEQGMTPPQGLFRVREYGGDRNDDHVEVDWLLPASLPSENGSETVPTWTSADVWPVFPDTFTRAAITWCAGAPDAGPALVQARTSVDAYVTEQHLVAHFPDGLPIRFWIFEAPLVDALLTADLVYNLNTQAFEMHNGVISGRAPGSALLHEIPKIQDLFKIPPQCRSHPSYPATKQFVCSTADWSCDESGDSQCDWASVGIAFETAPASVGESLAEPDVAAACPGDDDPGTDSCAN